uniref:Uncharacterized protein n=1 Tax=Steinernema glaseri TaxID=37863 RepID=A0A1I7YXY5_9BILA
MSGGEESSPGRLGSEGVGRRRHQERPRAMGARERGGSEEEVSRSIIDHSSSPLSRYQEVWVPPSLPHLTQTFQRSVIPRSYDPWASPGMRALTDLAQAFDGFCGLLKRASGEVRARFPVCPDRRTMALFVCAEGLFDLWSVSWVEVLYLNKEKKTNNPPERLLLKVICVTLKHRSLMFHSKERKICSSFHSLLSFGDFLFLTSFNSMLSPWELRKEFPEKRSHAAHQNSVPVSSVLYTHALF